MSEDFIKAVGKNEVAEVTRLLADSTLNPNYLYKTNSLEGNITALHIAAMKGHTEVLKLLLADPRVNKDALTSFGSTALHCAVTMGQVEITELLLNDRDSLIKNDFEIIHPENLVEFETQVKSWSEKHRQGSLLFIFYPTNQTWQVYLLKDEPKKLAYEDIPFESNLGKELAVITPSNLPSYNPNKLKQLWKAEPLFERSLTRDNGKKLPYFLAKEKVSRARTEEQRKNFAKIIEMLCVPTFVTACQEGDLDAVKDMVSEKIDLKGKYLGRTALFGACLGQHVHVVEYLLTLAGIDVDARTTNGNTILHALARGIALKRTNVITENEEQTALEFIMKLLIRSGADVNSKNDDQDTPLSLATFFQSYKIINLLVEQGADLTIKYPHPEKKDCIFDIEDFASDPGLLFVIRNLKIQQGIVNFDATQRVLNKFRFLGPSSVYINNLEISEKLEITSSH